MTAVAAARSILTQLHEVMASRLHAQGKLNQVVDIIGEALDSEVCSIYLLREGMLELFATRGLNQSFVGLQNYARLLADDAFWSSFRVSIAFTVICVVLHMVLGLALALLLNRLTIGRATFRVLFLTPWMIAPAIGATIWLWLLEPQFGVANYIVQSLGFVDRARELLRSRVKCDRVDALHVPDSSRPRRAG